MAPRKSKSRNPNRRTTARKPSRARAGAKPRKAAASGAAKAKPRAAKPKAPAASPLLAFARKIVRATQDPKLFSLRDLYAEGAVSREAAGDVATGFAGLEAKLARWDSMQERTEWKARKVFTHGDSICIEWDATVWTRDGRVVPFAEVAVHEVRGGKIVSERYYYNPMALAPQAAPGRPAQAGPGRPAQAP